MKLTLQIFSTEPFDTLSRVWITCINSFLMTVANENQYLLDLLSVLKSAFIKRHNISHPSISQYSKFFVFGSAEI